MQQFHIRELNIRPQVLSETKEGKCFQVSGPWPPGTDHDVELSGPPITAQVDDATDEDAGSSCCCCFTAT
jgi:hypothetical protein